jgi:hypothetical protein
MASTINGTSTGNGGLISTGDDSGILNIQTNETTAITVDASQNVGIGTTSPNGKLEISGSSTFIPTTTITADNAVTGWRVRRTGGTYPREYYIGIRENSTALDFYDNTADALRMRIGSGGIVSVGTTLTDNPLGGFVLYVANQNSQFMVGHETGSSSGNAYAKFCLNGSNIGSITQVGTTAVAYNTSSDYRLKENIAPITSALAKVAQLKPVTYTWKSSPEETGEGFIAHELAEVCPQAVHGTKDEVDADGKPVYQGIDTSFLVATLTAALQETKALIDTQAETINALTARIVALEGA